jgi:hypothetical protein
LSAAVYSATPAEQRSRLTVFFRGLLVLPHYVTLIVYGLGAALAVIAAWFALLFTGRYPDGLYAFVAKVSQYTARVSAYMYLLVDDYPPFDLGDHPEYPVQLQIPEPKESYSRVKVFFRGLLIIPVEIIAYALGIVSAIVTVIIWLMGVIVGSTPEGLSNAQKFCLSYSARAMTYMTLLVEDWPALSDDAAAPAAPAVPAPASFTAPDAGVTPPPPPPPPPGGNPFGE